MKNRNAITIFTTILLVLTCFGFLPRAQAVIPPPDGGYPGFNTAEGQNALFSLTTGVANTAVGWFSLRNNTEGQFNTALGAGTLLFNVDGTQNTATGAGALLFNTTGDGNTAMGSQALQNNITGNTNTAIGPNALRSNTSGGGNVALGNCALCMLTSGSNNVALGNFAGQDQITGNNNIYIGNEFGINGESDSCYIGNIFGATSSGGIGVLVNANGKLGTSTSSERFKEEIKPMDKASEALFSLKPVTFHYKKEIDPAGTSQLGLVAEDVEKVNPDLIVRDKEGNRTVCATTRLTPCCSMSSSKNTKRSRNSEPPLRSSAEISRPSQPGNRDRSKT